MNSSSLKNPDQIREFKSKLALVLWIVMALAGILFIFIASREWRSNWHIMSHGTHTQGEVVDLIRRPRKIGELSSSYAMAPVVRFMDQDGKSQLYYSTSYRTPAGYSIGETVELWYIPGIPYEAILKNKDEWILSIAFSVFGFLLCIISIPAIIRRLVRS